MSPFRILPFIFAAALSVTPNLVRAQVIVCGSEYVVRSGDSLAEIAERAYGSQLLLEVIYNANRREIGDDPSLIAVGTELDVPCLRQDEVQAPVESPATAPLINRSGDVAALTASDYAPFTEVAFPNRGMLTEIVNLAFEEISEHDLDIYWVDDWSAHLSTLMIERRAFDIGFPWYRPDCSRLDLLDSDSRLRCEYFNFSDALYTTVVSFFVRAGSDITLNNVPDFRGLELCRPDGYFTFDLTQRGIIDLPPDRDGMVAVFHQPDTLADCFRMLDDGRVDVVSVNTTTARAPLREIGMEDRVEVRDTMAETLSLHIVVPKALPNGEVLMLRINRALRALEADGTLDQVRRSALEFFYTN